MEKILLDDLRPAMGATSKSKRVGRGRASGHGKTSCRGNNGEGQRSGRSSKRGFEGGQMPGYRQMPKLKGFENFNSLNVAKLNVRDLNNMDFEEVTLEVLKENNLADIKADMLRVFGNSEVKKAVNVKAAYFTPNAAESIKKAGGKAEIV